MKNTQKIQRFLKEIATLLGGKPTLHKLQVLMYVYQYDKVTNNTLLKKVESTNAGISKICHDMSEVTSRKKPGIGILKVTADPMNLKEVYVSITPKGYKLLDPIFNLLD